MKIGKIWDKIQKNKLQKLKAFDKQNFHYVTKTFLHLKFSELEPFQNFYMR